MQDPSMALAVDAIETPALGRPFQLGMLYDCRKDTLIPGVTLWDYSSLQKDLTIKPQPKTESEIIPSDSIDDKASALDISASLKASFLAGLIEVGGLAKYLRDTKKSKEQARVTVQYKTTTRYEQLTMSHLGTQNVSHPDVFEHGTATHVVATILYGAQAFFVFDQKVSSMEVVKNTEGKLQVAINKLISVTGEGEENLSEEEKENALKFSCKFHGDFSLDKNPVTFQDAMKVYETLPKMLGKDGERAVPMKVWLYPLTKLDTRAAKMVREISLTLIFDVEKVLEELNEIQRQSNDLANDPIAETFPEIRMKIQQFKDLCQQYRQTFQKELARVLPSIRGGGQEEGTLMDILISVNHSPFNSQRLCEFLDTKKTEINFVKSYRNILNKMPVISSQNKLEEIVLDAQNAYVVCFVFTSLQEEEPFLLSLHDWLQEQFLRESGKSTRTTAVVKKGLAWFEDKERTCKARQAAKSIQDFFSINPSNEKVRFVVASLRDVDNPGASIYFYEDGELVSKNFELPSKPLPLLITELQHDSIQLNFQPAEYGRATISSYLVEYKAVGEENWKSVRTEDTRETFLLKDLNPNIDYLFQYAACCKVGCGRTSDLISHIKTLPITPTEKLKKVTATSEDNVARQFLQRSSLLEDRQSLVFALHLEKVPLDASSSCLMYQLGKKNLEVPNKVILMMGATQSGKTTLINGMINYILGVRWEDNFRFKLIHETTPRNKAGSRTSEVTAYVVNHQKGFQIPYSLTIIDMPGFGCTRDVEQDKLVEEQFREFFSTPGGIDHIDAICLVAQAFLAHSTHAQKCIFDSMLSMLGKDMKDNIKLLITFVDGGTPPVLEDLKKADLPCAHDKSGIPLHFRFNHSALFAQRESRGRSNAAGKMFWKMSTESMKNFFDSFKMLETKSLTLTMEVLKKHQALEAAARRPPPLKVEPIEPNRFHIRINPVAIGEAPVCRYLVEYRIAGEENWKSLLTDAPKHQFTLKDVRLKLPYQFRCAAVTQLALGQWSEEITCVYPLKPRDLPCATGVKLAESIPGLERRIVLVGKTRSGKSMAGNTILGNNVFEYGVMHYSKTMTCQKGKTQQNGRKMVVVDTPGFFHTSHASKVITAEVSKCVSFCNPGPHVILWAIRSGDSVEKEKHVAQLIKEIFGTNVNNYMILLVTQKGDLEPKTLEPFISRLNLSIRYHLCLPGNRFLAFNIRAEGEEREAQVSELMKMIDKLVEENGDAPCYTEDMMKAHQTTLKKK